MKTAFLYAGQGSQEKGMGLSFYESSPTFASVIDEAASYLDFDLKRTMFEDPDGLLNETEYTQPALAAFAAGVTALLKEKGLQPDLAAGLSLGEYSALYASDVFDLKTLMTITRKRGLYMTEAGAGMEALMCAVIGQDIQTLQTICDEIDRDHDGRVEISNDNAEGQIVISGEKKAVEKAISRLEDIKARTIVLKTSGAFHTSYMAPAAGKLKTLLEEQALGAMSFPILFNATASPLNENETVTDLLCRQIQSPVRMRETILYLASQGVDKVIEIGPGKAISGFIRRTVKGIKTVSLSGPSDLEKALLLMSKEDS